MTPLALRRFGLVVAGLFMGLFGLAFGFVFYMQAARIEEVRTQIGERVQIATDAIERIRIVEETAIEITLREVALLGEDGVEIVTAPRALLTLDASTIDGDGPIEFYDVALIDPVATLVQRPDGIWNIMEVTQLAAGGEPVRTEEGRPILLRGVEIENGRATIAIPAEAPADDARFVLDLPLTTIDGLTYQRYTVNGVNADLPTVRIGGAEGWRVEIGSFSGIVEEPGIQITEVQAVVEQSGEDAIAFDLETARFGDSSLSGAGTVTFAEAGPLYDLTLTASPLSLPDLAGFLPSLPEEGTAAFTVAVESVTPERVALAFTGLDLDAMWSRVTGALSIAAGGQAPLGLLDANLDLAPLDLVTLEQLGLFEDFPLVGQITGNVSTADAADGFAAVNLTAEIRAAAQPGAPPSTIFANGAIAVGDVAAPMRLDGISLSFQPLHLEALAGFAPEQADRLRGDLSGSVTLGGTLGNVELSGGDLAYEVGDAPPTRLVGLEGTISTDPELSYRISALAQPLALATVQELFPGLPFRAVTLSGPIVIAGDMEGMEIDADLAGQSGGIQIVGSVAFGELPRFDIEGNVRAFQAGMLLRPEVPVEGPLTGTFSIEGTMEDLAFNVDLEQAEGRFTLAGSLRGGQGNPIFQIAGNVTDFQLGALLGEPGLFPEPMSGNVDVRGGGTEPYIFDIALAGQESRIDISGLYEPDDIPTYNIEGFVAGLDLSALPIPLPMTLPRSNLTGRIDIEGRGLDPETLAGSYSFDFSDSTLSDLALDEALGRIEVIGGVAFVDTVEIRLENTELALSGSWGLQTPAADPLRYRFVSPDLSVIARIFAPGELVPPTVTGSISAAGTLGGSFEYPEIESSLAASNLRYEDWRAADLELTADLARDPIAGWNGTLTGTADQVAMPQIDNLEAVRLEASGSESSLAIGLFASRDSQSDISVSGLLELDGMRPLGIGLETMTLRTGGVAWELLDSARFRYVGDEGLLIENLVLERQGPDEGRISIDGMLPPTGNADLRFTGVGIELADFRHISDLVPPIEGRMTLNGLLEGPVGSPDLSIDGQILGLGYEGVVTDSVSFDFDYAAGVLSGFARASAGGRQLLDAELALPMSLSLEDRLIPAIEILEEGPLSMTIRADSLPLATIAAMVPGFAEGTGTARAMIDVSGTVGSPSLAGWARIEDGAITVVPLDTRYSGIQADIAMEDARAVINSFTITNGGPLTATGTIAFPSGTSPQLDVNAVFEEFLVMNDPDLAELIASGDVTVRGPASGPVVTGQVEVEESTIRIPELTQRQPELELAYAELEDLSAFGGDVAAPPLAGNFQIDGLGVRLGESVWLESEIMRVQIGGDLVLYQTGDELRVFGALQALRGTYTLEVSGIVRDFDVVSGRVQFFGTGDLNPSLDIVAAYRVPGGGGTGRNQATTVLINIAGTLLAPRLQLSADAGVQLSEADLLSILIFGQPNFDLGAFGPGVAGNLLVQEVVGGIVAAEIERPIVQAGLCDWVRVSPGSTGDISGLFGGAAFTRAVIECGWELAPSFFLTAEAGIGGLFGEGFTEGRIGVEWQIDDYWMWEASYGAMQRDPLRRYFDPTLQTQFSTDLTRRWEYGRPTQRNAIDLTPDSEPIPIEIEPALPPVQIGRREDD